jgi:hypothetical protein
MGITGCRGYARGWDSPKRVKVLKILNPLKILKPLRGQAILLMMALLGGVGLLLVVAVGG